MLNLISLKFIELTFKNLIFFSYRELQCVSITKTNLIILFREIIAVCSENHMENINTAWTKTVSYNVNLRGAIDV